MVSSKPVTSPQICPADAKNMKRSLALVFPLCVPIFPAILLHRNSKSNAAKPRMAYAKRRKYNTMNRLGDVKLRPQDVGARRQGGDVDTASTDRFVHVKARRFCANDISRSFSRDVTSSYSDSGDA
jgi:hypothetical protein